MKRETVYLALIAAFLMLLSLYVLSTLDPTVVCSPNQPC